ncbi:MAG: type II secretion system protein [Oligoflexia bacterium]|nr:type II secretion system protein [Oligoflexia bacterium]
MRYKSAFTLVEVLIALMILSITLVTLSSGEGVVLNATRKSKLVTLASIAARNLMTKIDVMAETNGFEYIKDLPEKEEKEFEEEDLRGWKWEREIKEVKFPVSAMINSIMAQSGNDEEAGEPQDDQMIGMIADNFEKILNESAREITVTVYWPVKAGQAFMNLKVVYYVVDYKVVQNYVPQI